MKLHELTPAAGATKPAYRKGRGAGSGNGKTAGRDEAPSAAPAPVFAVDPYPDGWYPAEDGRPPVPVMGGALPPCESESDVIREETGVKTVVQTVYYAPGSGSGSGSYTTSYTTSFRSSGSGSGGSCVFGSCVYTVGGYGLELI